MEKYLFDIDDVLSEIQKKGALPIIICGERKETDKFIAITKNHKNVIGRFEGSFDHTTEKEMLEHIEPVFREKRRDDEQKAM